MSEIYARSVWNPRYPDGEPVRVPKADGVAIHHSVTKTLSADASIADECEQMRELESIGHNRFGYGISYNVAVFPSGRAYQGVSFHKRGQHTGGMNSTVRSILFVGNYETHHPTQAQLNTVREIIADGRGVWWIKAAWVKGHSSFSETACPGKHVKPHLSWLANGKRTTNAPATPTTPERVTVNVNMPVVDLRDVTPRVRGRGVHLVQTLLVFAGYSIGKSGIDGIGGPSTRDALGKFQVDTGTGTRGRADYVVGAKSWRELIGGWQG